MKHIELFESYFSESENSSDFEMSIKELGSNPDPAEIVEVLKTFVESAEELEEVKKMYSFLTDNYDFAVTEDVLQSKETPESKAKIEAGKVIRDWAKKHGLI